MALTINLRKMLHRKSAEYLQANPFGNNGSGSFITSDRWDILPQHDTIYLLNALNTALNYNADQDSWLSIPSLTFGTALGAGSCGEFNPLGCPGGSPTTTASGGTTNTLTTTLPLVRSLPGCEIRVVSGVNAGYVGKIVSNTVGTNSTITVTPAASTAFTSTSVFQIFTGSVWVLTSGTTAFGVYDRATNAWTTRSITNLPGTWGTDGTLVVTTGRGSNRGTGFVNSTSVGTNSTTTLSDTGKNWPVNGWTNAQVRIISGTGLGQVRTISSNTATVLTVGTAWTTTPDTSSVYRIEGNDDYLYLLGNGAVTLYRYSISNNTWTALAPSTARAAAPGTGLSADWVDNVQVSTWSDGSYGNLYGTSVICQNGRFVYSMRGGASNVLDVYDIALNTWVNGVIYAQQTETLTSGSSSIILDGYIYYQKDATGRIFRFDVNNNVLEPWTINPVPQGAAVVGQKMIIANYIDGTDRLSYLYTLGNTRSEFTRWVII